MPRIFSVILAMSLLLLACGCASALRPQADPAPGAVLETLSAEAVFSFSNGDQGMSGSGYLLYQRPDRVRILILSPFGTALMEAVVSGERITVVDSSRGVAFSGLLADFPSTGEGKTWRHARWLIEMEPPGNSLRDGVVERINRSGMKERVTYENGVVVSKSLESGDMVRYKGYEAFNGVPLATEIILDSNDGGRFRIKLSEPEVNAGLAPDAFVPRLEGLKVYPLEVLRGQ